MMFLYISMVGSSNIIILSGIWVIRANFGGSGHAFKGWWLLLFFIMFLYISMVGSSNIIIVSGIWVIRASAVPCQYGQIIIYHHCIWYGRWRPNFGGSGDAFWRWWVTVVFDDISINEYGQIIIYHHCMWYGRWRANFGGSGGTFKGWWVTVIFYGVSIH